ncbi:MAG TPA: ribosomal protein S18-alanine N-acetyltransferase [Egicoccus sp.]|nr:ribosomal protein S18-alanine N-acetyltransferase [Egicoccus sp.]HSK22031.1 ribosomal protein S18-alanine N-acetyltransferase [Egicoccus sp.]
MTVPSDRAPDVEVVTAEPDDAEAIRALPGLGMSTRRLLDLDLIRDDRCCLVARSTDGAVVGFAMGFVLLDEAHVLDIAVAEPHRRQGIGRTLMDTLLDRVCERGATGVTLEVRRSNTAALALYRRLGFAVEGERPRYYPDGEDALLMWRRDREARD